MSEKIGIVDIGSNTMRLVIYERINGRKTYDRIENIKVTARLRSYFDENQSISEEGIHILIATIQDFVQILHHYEVKDFTCVATASIRLATNKEDILARVKQETNIDVELLSDYEEAYYGFLAVTQSMNIDEAITIDIGGGSTEVTYFHNKKIVDYHSFPFGALSLRLQFVKNDTATSQEKKKIHQFVDKHFRTLRWLKNRKIPLIAIGGSARNIGKLHQQLTNYPLEEIHQYDMSKKDLHLIKKTIAPLSFAELQKLDGVDKDRADTIHSAIEVFDSLYDYINATQLIISAKGLRDGILFQKQLTSDCQKNSLVEQSILELHERFYIGNEDGKQLTAIALKIFQEIQRLQLGSIILTPEDETLIRAAARIFNLGKKADNDTSNITFFLVTQHTILGLTHKERIQLALVASFKNRTLVKKYLTPFQCWFTEEEEMKICLLGAILKVAQSLNRSTLQTIQTLQFQQTDEEMVHAFFYCNHYYRPEEYHFHTQKKHLERLLKVMIVPHFQYVEDSIEHN